MNKDEQCIQNKKRRKRDIYTRMNKGIGKTERGEQDERRHEIGKKTMIKEE